MRYAAVTIDTEPDCTTGWTRSNPLTFNSIRYGIKEILQPLFKKYNVKPVYFVSPEILEDKKSIRILKSARCEIGNHLHSEYVEPKKEYGDFAGTRSKKYACFDYDDKTEFEKIRNFDKKLTNHFGKPTSYRAARFGADLNTIRSLEKLGYTVDSSVTPNISWAKQGGPDFQDYPDQPYFIGLDDFKKPGKSKIMEIPVTIGSKRLFFLPDKWLFYSWLRPTHMTVFEQKQLINNYVARYDSVILCMMFHSMELIPGASPYVRTKFGSRMFIRRLEKIIIYLKQNDFKFKSLQEIRGEF